MTKQKDWLIRFFKGIIIALGFIVPGASGSLLAAILGIYEKLLNFLANLTKEFKENFFFFLPIGIGGILGIGLLSAPLDFLLERYQIMILWGFAGIIIGTIPSLYKTSTLKRKRETNDIILFLFAAGISFFILYFMSDLSMNIPDSFVGFIIAGGIIAIGVLIPGLSPTNILLILGIYHSMLDGFRNFDFLHVFLPIMIGGAISVLLLSKIMDNLIKKHHTRMYHVILGLVVSSTILIVIPPVANYSGITMINIIVSVLLFLIGICLGLGMGKLEEKYK